MLEIVFRIPWPVYAAQETLNFTCYLKNLAVLAATAVIVIAEFDAFEVVTVSTAVEVCWIFRVS